MLRGTFMSSQARQYAQIPLIDAIVRMWREGGVVMDRGLLDSDDAHESMTRRPLPPGHMPVPDPAEIEMQFRLWWQMFLRIGRYVFGRDARYLPMREDLEATKEKVGGEDYMRTFAEEEMSAVWVMFERYRIDDPQAEMDSDSALLRHVLPAMIQADRYWVSNRTRERPGRILADPHGSMMRTLITESARKRSRGWVLSDCEVLYARMGEVLDWVRSWDPEYSTLPTYLKLINEYNAAHPDATVSDLHAS
jgi:hypothetical protein